MAVGARLEISNIRRRVRNNGQRLAVIRADEPWLDGLIPSDRCGRARDASVTTSARLRASMTRWTAMTLSARNLDGWDEVPNDKGR